MSAVEIPLFPLHTVLFPGGVLPLRIFEARYLAMISRCLKDGDGFGVVSIDRGQEAGVVESFYRTGTLAGIVDFDRLADGLLGITCRGEQRLRVLSQRSQADRLLVGQVEWLPPEPRLPPRPEHQPLMELLRGLLAQEALSAYRRWLTEDWEDAAWLGNRLAEMLPFPVEAKQTLLMLQDPLQRLDLLLTALQEPAQPAASP